MKDNMTQKRNYLHSSVRFSILIILARLTFQQCNYTNQLNETGNIVNYTMITDVNETVAVNLMKELFHTHDYTTVY